jgi:hypothetical protein
MGAPPGWFTSETLEEAVVILVGFLALFLAVWWASKKLFSNVEKYDYGKMSRGETIRMLLLMVMSVAGGELIAEAAVDVGFSGLSDQALFRGLRFVLGIAGGVVVMIASLKIWEVRRRGARSAA